MSTVASPAKVNYLLAVIGLLRREPEAGKSVFDRLARLLIGAMYLEKPIALGEYEEADRHLLLGSWRYPDHPLGRVKLYYLRENGQMVNIEVEEEDGRWTEACYWRMNSLTDDDVAVLARGIADLIRGEQDKMAAQSSMLYKIMAGVVNLLLA